MKKFILGLALMLSSGLSCQAQEVYNYLVDKATQKVNSSYTNEYEVKKYDFELTALNYMKRKALSSSQAITTRFLDEQAYYLDTFILRYLTIITHTPDADKQSVSKIFMGATLDNPMYNDTDTETTQAYIEEKGTLCPFSIDCNWQKALEQVEKLNN